MMMWEKPAKEQNTSCN